MGEPRAAGKIIHLATRCTDEAEFIRRFHPFVGSSALAIPGNVPGEPGTEARLVISLRNLQPVMEGRCRLLGAEEDANVGRVRVVLELLELTPKSKRLHERLLARRRAMGLEVTPSPVTLVRPLPRALPEGAAAAQLGLAEQRTPGSSYQLPANPLSQLEPADLASFVECTLFEEPTNAPPLEPSPAQGVGFLPDLDGGDPSLPPERGRTQLFYGPSVSPSEKSRNPAQPSPPPLPLTSPSTPAPEGPGEAIQNDLAAATSPRKTPAGALSTPPPSSSPQRLEDEPTTPGFDNPSDAIRHLFLAPPAAPQAEAVDAPPETPPTLMRPRAEAEPQPPPNELRPPPAPKAPAPPPGADIPTIRAQARETGTVGLRRSWQGAVRRWGPFLGVAATAFWLGYMARGRPPQGKGAALPSVVRTVPHHGARKADDAAPRTTTQPHRAAGAPPRDESSSSVIPTHSCVATVTSLPRGATVTWAGRSLGRTPLAQVSVPCGPANVILSRQNFDDFALETQADATTPASVFAKLKHQQTRLIVTSEPPGALVQINQRRIGPTPRQVNVFRGQALILRLHRTGFRPHVERVVPREATLDVAAILAPLEVDAKTAPRVAPVPAGAAPKVRAPNASAATAPKVRAPNLKDPAR